jgi:hypothetical protein
MNATHRRLVLAAIPPAIALAVLVVTGPPGPQRPAPAPPPSAAAAPTARVAPPSLPPTPSATDIAARAARHLLRAEHHPHQAPPRDTFTPALARELRARPPRPAPAGVPAARLTYAHEQAPVDGLRRVRLTVRRGGERERVTVLLVCDPACLVASVE